MLKLMKKDNVDYDGNFSRVEQIRTVDYTVISLWVS
ncbi:hypothetical protein BCL90_4362 [Pedobacter alluvionis]|uniref:Uncharacterized protein n=1 Tax=Pedobacter alluvionis TaxID=475253 RepID=A0A497XYY8_9SPHI|nr:hypothetical protein BCL90_4362 [Pedobacter alluvionis]